MFLINPPTTEHWMSFDIMSMPEIPDRDKRDNDPL